MRTDGNVQLMSIRAVVAGGEAIFKETVTFEVTMEQVRTCLPSMSCAGPSSLSAPQDAKTQLFDEKYLSVSLVELAEKGSKGAKLGKAIINLADYCKDGLSEVKEVPMGKRAAVLLMGLQCEWLRLNKKTIVKVAPSAPQPAGLSAVSIGAEQLFLANTGACASVNESALTSNR